MAFIGAKRYRTGAVSRGGSGAGLEDGFPAWRIGRAVAFPARGWAERCIHEMLIAFYVMEENGTHLTE
jgi:hypothetical protein